MLNSLQDAIVALAVVFLFFIIAREFFCWYWKMNKTVELLKEIKTALIELKPSVQAVQVQESEIRPD